MAKALRTIPIVLEIADDMQEHAPEALLVNFTNPSGLITEALQKYAPEIASVGVCNGPISTKMKLLKVIEELRGQEAPPDLAELDALGLNHLSWNRGLVVDGEEVWEEIIGNYELYPDQIWDRRTLEALRMIPNPYLKYYYYTEQMIADQDKWPPSRAEQVMEIEADLMAKYADPERQAPPPELMKRGGAYYSTVATQLLNAHHNDLGETHILNTRHHAAVDGWPTDWVLEIPCRVDARGITPHTTEPLPKVCYGLLSTIKSYELLTAEAAVHGDRSAAYQALLVNPLGPEADRVEEVLTDLIQTNKDYLPQFT